MGHTCVSHPETKNCKKMAQPSGYTFARLCIHVELCQVTHRSVDHWVLMCLGRGRPTLSCSPMDFCTSSSRFVTSSIAYAATSCFAKTQSWQSITKVTAGQPQ